MWNYYKTVVINSDVAEDGHEMFFKSDVVRDGAIVKDGAVNVWRNGQYDLEKIGKITETPGYKGENAKLTIKCDGLIPEAAEGVHDLGP